MHSKRSRQSDGAESKVSPVRTSDRLRRRPSNPYGRHFVYYTQSSFYNSNKKKSKSRAAASHIAKFIESKASKKVKNRTNKEADATNLRRSSRKRRAVVHEDFMESSGYESEDLMD